MSGPDETLSWWLVPIPGILALLPVYFILRKRRWRDLTVLRRAVCMPPEHIAQKPRAVRDLRTGESGWVSRSYVVTSKRGRVFVSWTAILGEAPDNPQSEFAALQIVRRKRGFSLAIRPGVEFGNSLLPWGEYAPVIEISQTVSDDAQNESRHANG